MSVFLVNNRNYNQRQGYSAFAFQTVLVLTSPDSFVPRPDLRGSQASALNDDWDEKIADLHYRDLFEYAVGHGVSALAGLDEKNACRTVVTEWLPQAEVERVEPSLLPEVVLSMEALGALADGGDATTKLQPLVTQYRAWISVQQGKLVGLCPQQTETAKLLLHNAGIAAGRIEAGIALLADTDILLAFSVANRAMAAAARCRDAARTKKKPIEIAPPTWRPFQLAFMLMTLQGIADPLHHERETVDLLFFPTMSGLVTCGSIV